MNRIAPYRTAPYGELPGSADCCITGRPSLTDPQIPGTADCGPCGCSAGINMDSSGRTNSRMVCRTPGRKDDGSSVTDCGRLNAAACRNINRFSCNNRIDGGCFYRKSKTVFQPGKRVSNAVMDEVCSIYGNETVMDCFCPNGKNSGKGGGSLRKFVSARCLISGNGNGVKRRSGNAAYIIDKDSPGCGPSGQRKINDPSGSGRYACTVTVNGKLSSMDSSFGNIESAAGIDGCIPCDPASVDIESGIRIYKSGIRTPAFINIKDPSGKDGGAVCRSTIENCKPPVTDRGIVRRHAIVNIDESPGSGRGVIGRSAAGNIHTVIAALRNNGMGDGCGLRSDRSGRIDFYGLLLRGGAPGKKI